MSHTQSNSQQVITVHGIKMEAIVAGRGRPLLFLHPGLGLFGADAFLARLGGSHQVIAPSHPGFGHSDLPDWMSNVDDLAYFYLDLLDELDIRDAVLVGASLGGWIAAEIAVKSTARHCRHLWVAARRDRPAQLQEFVAQAFFHRYE
jgi:pimeloyl-ACP methyl ester carboxylesterase